MGEKGRLLVCINADTKNNGEITSAKIGDFYTSYNDSKKAYCATVSNDNKYLNNKLSLVNSSGKKWISYNSFSKDTEKPTGLITINSIGNTYNSNKVNTYIDFSDKTSKIDKVMFQNENYTTFVNGQNGYEKRLTFNNLVLTSSLDGSIKKLSAAIYDKAGNEIEVKSSDYIVYKACQPTNIVADGDWYNKSGASCSKVCGSGTVAQEQKQKDKKSGTACETISRNGSCNTMGCCDKTEVYKTTTGTWGTCSKTCGTGQRSRTDVESLRSAYDHKTTCGTRNVTKTENCNTQSCLSLTKISGVDATYCSLRNPWGYSTKYYTDSITSSNCRDVNSNPRVTFKNINGSISGTTAKISVTLDIYSTSWEMLATSSNDNNKRVICVTNGNTFSNSTCVSNSVEIKSKSSTWKSNTQVLRDKEVTMTVDNVNNYSNLAFKIYSPGHGVNAKPTCTHTSGASCNTSTGSPFIFQSAYFFKVNK